MNYDGRQKYYEIYSNFLVVEATKYQQKQLPKPKIYVV
jgi:hypothetical protein